MLCLRPRSENLVFPRFRDWTHIYLVDEVNRIKAPVKDYRHIEANLGRLLRARRRARTYLAQAAKVTRPKDPTQATRPKSEYVQVGVVKNRVSVGQYGIHAHNQHCGEGERTRDKNKIQENL